MISLKLCRMGALVVENPEHVKPDSHPRIGHVIGLGQTHDGIVIPIVQWARRDTPTGGATLSHTTMQLIRPFEIVTQMVPCEALDEFTGDSFREAD